MTASTEENATSSWAATARQFGASLMLQWRAAPAMVCGLAVLTVAAGAVPPSTAWLTKLLIDQLSTRHPQLSSVLLLAGGVAVAGAVSIIVLYVTGYVDLALKHRTTLQVEQQLFARVVGFRGLRHFEHPTFHDRLRLAEEAAHDAPPMVLGFTQETLRASVTIISYAGTLIAVWPPMAALLFAIAAIAFVARLANARRQANVATAMAGTYRRRLLYRALLTDVQAAKEIRLFGLGSMLHQRMVGALRSASNAELTAERLGALVQGGIAIISALVSGAGILFVVYGTVHSWFTVGDVALFTAAVAGVQAAFTGVVVQAGPAMRSLRLFGNYLQILDTPNDLDTGQLPVWPLRGSIDLYDVWFRYDEDGPWVLKGVNLSLPAEHAVGLVGVNGAGKSTVVKLLSRFYDPTHGVITWDGVDIRALDLDQLRRRMAATYEDAMSYDLSAAENIGLGDLDQLDDRTAIQRAAQLAGVDTVIDRLPAGYDTVLSRTFAEDDATAPGQTLSGGQWQRIALARTFLRDNADLLILDEPSANLDAMAEYRLQQTLQDHAARHTRLLISHRLNTLRDADRIAVLVDGRIVEDGPHDILMAEAGEYARLFHLQAWRYQDARVASTEGIAL